MPRSPWVFSGDDARQLTGGVVLRADGTSSGCPSVVDLATAEALPTKQFFWYTGGAPGASRLKFKDIDGNYSTMDLADTFIFPSTEPPVGYNLWLKADSLELSDNDPVENWLDESASNFDFAQATASRKPLFKTNIANSKPGIFFDGGDDTMATAGAVDLAASSHDFTLFVVLKLDADLTNAGSAFNHSVVGAGGLALQHDAGSSLMYGVWKDDSAVYQGTTETADVGSAAHIVRVRKSGVGYTIHLDNVQTGIAVVSALRALTSAVIDLGRNGDEDNLYYKGHLLEIIHYPYAVSAGESTQAHSYLGGKYNIAI